MDLESKDNLRDLIIQKSSRLFVEQGYKNTTIRQIAEACELGRGHLYYYFRKKEDIVLYLYKDLIEHIYSYISKLDSNNNPLISYAIIQSIYIKSIATNKELFRMYIELSKVDSVRNEYIKILRDLLIEKIQELHYEEKRFTENDINLSIIIGSAGEDELLRRFYKNETELSLEEIIKSTIRTRLLLLNISHDEVNEIIIYCEDVTKNMDINSIVKNINYIER